MKINLYKTYENLSKTKDKDAFFTALQTAVHSLGFEYCAYGIRSIYPISSHKTYVINNYPEDWNQTYVDNNYLEIDPTVKHGLRSTQALFWADDVFREAPYFWEEARSFGIKQGISQSQKDENGRISMLTFASDNPELTQKTLILQAPSLIWLSQLAHTGLADKMMPLEPIETEHKLTKREIDILRWTAEGKTSNEISILMSISDRTVNFHINNVLKKLSASNKTAATVKAMMLNLL
ncbi:autoinducer binding domain-containing protein [Budvicia diplopodorum]|uniref:autoinducer binding domain-containing protein n=1 Tax=Budvicia diplopodorum TaxID=1119056 RepID=UPI001359550A|nr:autoinducer binding domain-containing protein [Budvicia diplopodorum]